MEKNENDKERNKFVDMLYGNAYYALIIIVVSISVTTIFNFFGIDFEYYGVYLLFFVGLAILSQILPKTKSGFLQNIAATTTSS
jgi:hypothetical protein